MNQDAGLLMARVRSRDADAFESLYDEYHRIVYGVALRMSGDASAAEDITQAVFLKVWSAPDLFRSENFGAGIVRVTRNTLRSSHLAVGAGWSGEGINDAHDPSMLDDVAVYALGPLPARDAARVRAHLTSCARCQAEYKALKPAVTAPAAPEEQSPSALLKARIMRSVRADAQAA
ncbi:MAG: RNA polymerase sigma factor, partial [Vulcanimicrobiaceae bacterium]